MLRDSAPPPAQVCPRRKLALGEGGAGLHLYFLGLRCYHRTPKLDHPALSLSAVRVGEAGGGDRACSLSWRYPELALHSLGLAGSSGRSAGVERAEGPPVTPTRTGLCVLDVLCSGLPFPSPWGHLWGSADGSPCGWAWSQAQDSGHP